MTFVELISQLEQDVRLNPSHGVLPISSQNGGEIRGLGLLSRGGWVLIDDYRPEITTDSCWATFDAMFKLARIEVLNHWELVNPYWPRSYMKEVMENPWWLVKTNGGLVKIGWRKRVIEIDWSDTSIREIVTDDDTTKTDRLVHAWTEEKAIQYLKRLGAFMAVPA